MAAPYLEMLDKNKKPNRIPANGLKRNPKKTIPFPAP
jgi:hypothetical protein